MVSRPSSSIIVITTHLWNGLSISMNYRTTCGPFRPTSSPTTMRVNPWNQWPGNDPLRNFRITLRSSEGEVWRRFCSRFLISCAIFKRNRIAVDVHYYCTWIMHYFRIFGRNSKRNDAKIATIREDSLRVEIIIDLPTVYTRIWKFTEISTPRNARCKITNDPSPSGTRSMGKILPRSFHRVIAAVKLEFMPRRCRPDIIPRLGGRDCLFYSRVYSTDFYNTSPSPLLHRRFQRRCSREEESVGETC